MTLLITRHFALRAEESTVPEHVYYFPPCPLKHGGNGEDGHGRAPPTNGHPEDTDCAMQNWDPAEIRAHHTRTPPPVPTVNERQGDVREDDAMIVVEGSGASRFNGMYYPDPGAAQEPGFSRGYRQSGGQGTLEWNYLGWRLTENYAGWLSHRTYYMARWTTSRTPPLTGWAPVYGWAPTPTFRLATPEEQVPLVSQARPCSAPHTRYSWALTPPATLAGVCGAL